MGPVSQTLTGLTAGQTYNLSFDQAAAQLSGNFGATTEQWIVTIGGTISGAPTMVLLSDLLTPYTSAYVVNSPDYQWRSSVILNASGGFSGWQSQSESCVANASTELLAFLGAGTPIGGPPIVLLDNVSLDAASSPEPGSLALFFLGAGMLAAVLTRQLRKRSS